MPSLFGVHVAFVLACAITYACAHAHQAPQAQIHMENLRWDSDPTLSKAVLTAETSFLYSPSGWVTVTFSNVLDPQEDDWIGVFSPSNVNFTEVAPIKYQFCRVSSKFLITGSGSITFDILNMHADVVFVFFRHGTTFPVYETKSNVVQFDNYNYPMQGHLAITENANEMRLSWAIGTTYMTQYVMYGLSSGEYQYSAQAISSTYTKADLCGDPATGQGWRDPGYLQTAVMPNLAPNTQYYYRYGSDASGWSPEYSFKSAPVPAPGQWVSLIAFGDMGKAEVDGSDEHWEEEPSLNTTQNMVDVIAASKTEVTVSGDSDGIDLVLHIGDIAYAVGFSSQWDEFMNQILPVATQVPYMTCIGNHERDYPDSNCYYNVSDSGGECGVPYESRFIMPGTEYTPDDPWFSFDYGNIHFVLMSTEHNFQVGSDQYNFLATDLENVDRSVTPYIIFGGHRPMYIDSMDDEYTTSDQQVAALLRENLEPLLLDYQVDMALWGHHHSYQRTCPVYNVTCQSDTSSGVTYPTHVVIGMAGMALSKNIDIQQPKWIEYVDDDNYGYSIIYTNSTHIRLQFFTNQNVLMDDYARENQFM